MLFQSSTHVMFTTAVRKFTLNAGRVSTLTRLQARGFSNELPGAVSAPASGGSSFGQRLVAFLAGLGVGCGTSFFIIYEELGTSNARFTKHFQDLQNRVEALEKK